MVYGMHDGVTSLFADKGFKIKHCIVQKLNISADKIALVAVAVVRVVSKPVG